MSGTLNGFRSPSPQWKIFLFFFLSLLNSIQAKNWVTSITYSGDCNSNPTISKVSIVEDGVCFGISGAVPNFRLVLNDTTVLSSVCSQQQFFQIQLDSCLSSQGTGSSYSRGAIPPVLSSRGTVAVTYDGDGCTGNIVSYYYDIDPGTNCNTSPVCNGRARYYCANQWDPITYSLPAACDAATNGFGDCARSSNPNYYISGALPVSTSGGTVSFRGNFLLNAGAATISVGGVSCGSPVYDNSTLNCTLPAGQGKRLWVALSFAQQGTFTSYFSYSAPVISAVTASNFSNNNNTVSLSVSASNQGSNNVVSANGLAGTFNSGDSTWSFNFLVGISNEIVIKVGNQSSVPFIFVAPKPTINSVSRVDPAGGIVDVQGSRFGNNPALISLSVKSADGNTVKCSAAAFSTTGTRFTCALPSGLGGNLPATLTVADQTVPFVYSYLAPQLDSVLYSNYLFYLSGKYLGFNQLDYVTVRVGKIVISSQIYLNSSTSLFSNNSLVLSNLDWLSTVNVNVTVGGQISNNVQITLPPAPPPQLVPCAEGLGLFCPFCNVTAAPTGQGTVRAYVNGSISALYTYLTSSPNSACLKKDYAKILDFSIITPRNFSNCGILFPFNATLGSSDSYLNLEKCLTNSEGITSLINSGVTIPSSNMQTILDSLTAGGESGNSNLLFNTLPVLSTTLLASSPTFKLENQFVVVQGQRVDLTSAVIMNVGNAGVSATLPRPVLEKALGVGNKGSANVFIFQYNPYSSFDQTPIYSNVTTVSILNAQGNEAVVRDLTTVNVTIKLSYSVPPANGFEYVCSYFNTTVFSWRSNGCTVTETGAKTITCSCNHLTSFTLRPASIFNRGD
eukprot:TRINITY_DN5729_c0_g1_i1.p1 TRINITY_DN5729_c0_g1~~TRINITY_DN5729_c0_g1_i1.p1  ORF type:complete len:873 (+),score=282.70 TRINITY_DN5729_c0_g1_i1:84-2621(+)